MLTCSHKDNHPHHVSSSSQIIFIMNHPHHASSSSCIILIMHHLHRASSSSCIIFINHHLHLQSSSSIVWSIILIIYVWTLSTRGKYQCNGTSLSVSQLDHGATEVLVINNILFTNPNKLDIFLQDALKACNDLNNRWFGGRPIYAELTPVTDFREACCRQYETGECTR